MTANTQVVIKTNDEYNGMTAEVETVHADGSASLYNKTWDDAMTFASNEFYNPTTHETERVWADGHEVIIVKAKETAAPVTQETPEYRHDGWCEKCQSYCYGDCTA